MILMIFKATFSLSSITIGRMKQECGHIGVSIIPFTLGFTIGPPADKEYAVEPVGVDIINPSAL